MARRLLHQPGPRQPLPQRIVERGVSAMPTSTSTVATPGAAVLRLGDPSTISRLVVPGWVDAVERVVLAGTSAHVREEVHEVVAPALAHRDPTSAVDLVGGVAGVIAAAPHRRPRRVGRSSCPAVLVTRRLLGRVGPKLFLRLGRVVLALHRVCDAGVVTRNVLADAIAAFVDGGVLATSASTELRNQRRPVLHVPLRLGDLLLRFLGVASASGCHENSVCKPKKVGLSIG